MNFIRQLTVSAALGGAIVAATAAAGAAQGFDLEAGATLTSRHMYRGIQLGNAPQVQPSLTLTTGQLDVGIWGSHPATYDGGSARPYKEAIAWAAYRLPLAGGDAGTLVPYVQSHYSVVGAFTSADNHFIQTQLSWIGPESLPLDFMGGVVVYNDPENSVYLEAGYRTRVDGMALRFFVGGTPGPSPFNGSPEAALTNVGLSGSWPLELSESTTLALGYQFIVNPRTGELYPVVSLSL